MRRNLVTAFLSACFCLFAALSLAATPSDPPPPDGFAEACQSAKGEGGRVVCADIAAIDQTLVYNRFGSFNPFGMIFALYRDLAPLAPVGASAGVVDLTGGRPLTAGDCNGLLGTETRDGDGALSAGNVRLRDCKRPRPMVLRTNVGDTLVVRVSNLLAPGRGPGFSEDFCIPRGSTADEGRERVRDAVAEGDADLLRHGEADCRTGAAGSPGAGQGGADWPDTRAVNFVVQGLAPLPMPGEDEVHPACFGTGAVAPDGAFLCRYRILQEGTYFFASLAAPAGGEGQGGSLVHGLFGAIMAERP